MLIKHAEEATEEKLSQHKCGEMAGSTKCSRQRKCLGRLQGLSGGGTHYGLGFDFDQETLHRFATGPRS